MKNIIKFLAFVIMLLQYMIIDAQSVLYDSNKVENSIVVNRPADRVWELISNFENLPKLVPAVIKNTEVNGTGVYASWIIYLNNNQLVKEEMTYFNAKEMELSYIMTKTPMPLSDYLAFQKVEVIDAARSRVYFTTYFNVLPANQELLQNTFDNFQKAFLKNIEINIP